MYCELYVGLITFGLRSFNKIIMVQFKVQFIIDLLLIETDCIWFNGLFKHHNYIAVPHTTHHILMIN